jgi:hypothetical protein
MHPKSVLFILGCDRNGSAGSKNCTKIHPMNFEVTKRKILCLLYDKRVFKFCIGI